MMGRSWVFRGFFLLSLISVGFQPAFAKNTCSEGIILVVNAYSSGNLLPKGFQAYGARLGHLHDRPDTNKFDIETFHAEDFEFDLIHNGDLDATLTALNGNGQRIIRVIAGSEDGVELADALNERLGLPGNGTRLSAARRNKFLMHEVLRRAGLRHIKQFKSPSWRAVEEWIIAHKKWPVVLKPLRSAGTDLVFFAEDMDQAREAFEKIYMRPNAYGDINTEVLIQEYIEGQEYMVNFVSTEGQQRLSDVWKYGRVRRNGSSNIYDEDSLLSASGQEQDQLIPYALQVLKAFEVLEGPSHLEIKLTDTGPVLVEIGTRACGAGIPELCNLALGRGQIEMTAQAVMDSEAFLATHFGYEIQHHASLVFLHSEGRGGRLNKAATERIKRLPGFHKLKLYFPDGELLPKTIDAVTLVGMIQLLHEDEAVLRRSAQQIKDWQNENLFER
jgi:hypothetical protein